MIDHYHCSPIHFIQCNAILCVPNYFNSSHIKDALSQRNITNVCTSMGLKLPHTVRKERRTELEMAETKTKK